MSEREAVIGIDLGTTNSVVATVQDDQPVVIPNRTGQNLTPSVVAISKNGKQLVGQLAKRQAITNPDGTVYATKRLIGRKFSSDEVGEAIKVLSYQVVCGEHDDIRVRLADKDISLQEISAKILAELKLDAEEHFGRPVDKAVVTVPAYFTDGQRKATKDAGRIAGLDVLRILNEPTAAALAYGLGKSINGKIAIFDLGGGTFDISVLEISKGVFQVIARGADRRPLRTDALADRPGPQGCQGPARRPQRSHPRGRDDPDAADHRGSEKVLWPGSEQRRSP